MTNEILLSISGLQKAFGGLIAVNQMQFDVHGGEILGLLGPNGSIRSVCIWGAVNVWA